MTVRRAPRLRGDARERLDAGIYFAGTLFQRVSLFLAVPLLLRSLSAADYGTFGLLQSAVNLLPPLLALNLPATITRLFFDGATPDERRAIGTKLSILSGGFTLFGAAALWLGVDATRSVVGALLGIPAGEVMLATSFVLLGSIGSNHLQMAWGIWRAEKRAARTAVANTATGLLFLGAIGLLVFIHRLGSVSAVGAYACATALVGVSANLLATSRVPPTGKVRYDKLTQEALRYGLPVLPYLLALWGLGAGGRWIARGTLSLADTGRFTLASQLTTMLSLVGRSAYEAWAPRSFEMVAGGRHEDARHYLRTRGRLTLAVVAGLSFAMASALWILLPRFAPAYGGVAVLFPLMALAPLFDVAYMAKHTELMGLKVTRPIAGYTAISTGVFVLSGTLGARFLGLWGLVGAYVLAYFVQWLLATRAVSKARTVDPTVARSDLEALGLNDAGA